MKAIGPTFFKELQAAAVSLDGYSWDAFGNFTFRNDVSQAVKDAVAAVYTAHDPLAVLTPDDLAGKLVDTINRMNFEVAFNIENRVRVLEGKVAITRVQYRNALITIAKTLL